MFFRSVFVLTATGLLLLTACPAAHQRPEIPYIPMTLTELGSIQKLDEHHRVSIREDYEIVSALREPPWLFYRHLRDLKATDFTDRAPVVIPTTRNHTGGLGTRSWSADGTRLFDFEGQVFAVDLRTLEVTVLTHFRGGGENPEWLPGPIFAPLKYFHDASEDSLIVLLQRYRRPALFGRGSGHEYPDDAGTLALAIDLKRGTERVLFTDPERLSSWAACAAKRVLYLNLGDRLEIRKFDGTLFKTLHVPERITGDLILSSDGSRFLVEGPDFPDSFHRGFSILDVQTGTRLADYAEGHWPSWAPDGKSIAFVRNYSELWIYDCEAETASAILAIDTCIEQAAGYGSPPVWSPDGRFLAVHVSASRGRHKHTWYTVIIDFHAKEMKIIHAAWTHLAWLPQKVGRFD